MHIFLPERFAKLLVHYTTLLTYVSDLKRVIYVGSPYRKGCGHKEWVRQKFKVDAVE